MSRARALLACLAALLPPVAAGTAAHAQPITFGGRLTVPVTFDDVGYGQCVTADLHTGEVFVCDPRTNRILIFDADGIFRHQILGGQEYSGVEDLAVDPEGLLLVLASREGLRTVIELDFDGLFLREVQLAGLPEGLPPPSPVSLALSLDGERLYLLDGAGLRLWIADRDGLVVGSVDLAADLNDRLRRDLFFGHVDVYGNSVLVAIPTTGEIRRFELDGTPRDQVGLKGATRCQLGRATAAALTEEDQFLVVDQQRMVLTRWVVRNNRCLSEELGIGSRAGRLYYPHDLSLDARGRLYIAQSFEGRVQYYDGLAAAAGSAAVGPP